MKRVSIFAAAMVFATLALAGAAFAEEQWKTYTDKTFGFSVEYPDIYNEVEDPYVDGDGISNFGTYSSASGGQHAFSVSGGQKPKGADGNSLLKEATNMEEDENGYVYGVAPIEGTAKSGADFYTYEYLNDSAGVDGNGEPACITHIYGVVGQTGTAEYRITYPKGEAGQYAEITARMDTSLKVK
ncbi:MAG: hypothetical protein LBV79_06115 [Candidatus Adiutrix sp.]|jgi:hypothetical protein|nr:hypothetical protein [Candidatus Adiutrix sp.]